MEDYFEEVGQKANYTISDFGSNLRRVLADINMPDIVMPAFLLDTFQECIRRGGKFQGFYGGKQEGVLW